jgi:hypothetical protein
MIQETNNFCYQTKKMSMSNIFWGADFIFKVKISSPKFLITYQMMYLKLPAGRRKLVISATKTANSVKEKKTAVKCTCQRTFCRYSST